MAGSGRRLPVPDLLLLRPLTDAEAAALRALAESRTAEARLRDRARICWRSAQGARVSAIVAELGRDEATVRLWIKRFNAAGPTGLADAPRSGRPPVYTPAQLGQVVATSLTDPASLDLPFGSWTLDRLTAYLNDTGALPIKRSRVREVLQAEGLRWRTQEGWFGARVDPEFAAKRGRS
jgi:transposase